MAAFILGFSKPLLDADKIPEKPRVFIQPFSLPIYSQEQEFDLEDQGEGIYILDFFAYWCIPCLQTSKELEHDILSYYESRGGNPHGLPVKVLSINVESRLPHKTEEFIKKAGIRLALNDNGGKLLEKLGSNALPFIVILKSYQEKSKTILEVLYQSSGYPGSTIIRETIDATNPSIPNSEEIPTFEMGTPELIIKIDPGTGLVELPVPETISTGVIAYPPTKVEPAELDETVELKPVIEDLYSEEDIVPVSESQPTSKPSPKGMEYSANTDILSSSDISLYALSLQRNREFRSAALDLILSFGIIDINYEPFSEADVIGKPIHLEETSQSSQISASVSTSPFFQYQISGGGYVGFSDHNSLWLNEYYRQQFSGLDGYIEADPWGYNVSGGFSWDTSSAPGTLSTTIIFQQDDAAPGYDRPLFQPLERGRQRLKTNSILLEQESVITKTSRIRNQLQLTKTTDRELRYRYSGNLNLALGENWVLRIEGASTFEAVEAEEESDFKSYSGGLILEYDWDQAWFLSFEGRRYSDNGQIETSILVSSGPPPLDTRHFGVTLRHQGERSSWKLSLAAYQSSYDEIDSPIRPFGNLYQDRDWLLTSASYTRTF